MNTLAFIYLTVALLVVGLSFPLILGKVPINRWYGVRIPESFQSKARWYEINRFGGWALVAWAVLLAILAGVAQWSDPNNRGQVDWILPSIAIVGLMAVMAAVLRYAAKTRHRS